MSTRYCLKYELGLCPQSNPRAGLTGPLFLVDSEGHSFRLEFNCTDCGMDIYLALP